ncbi:TPA: SPFH domain-containing protein [Escherichia coli]|nr:SPFH domain-containing protein [Escherichia coli]
MKRILLGLAMLATCFTLTGCFGIIDQGNVGVRTSFGEIKQEPVTGMYQTFFSDVTVYTTKETNVAITGMTPRARDNLTLKELDVVIYYTTNPLKLPTLQATTAGQSAKLEGDDFLRPGYILIDNLGRSMSMDAASHFDSLTIHANRPALEKEIAVALQAELDKAQPGTFKITRVVVTTAQTDPTIEKSIQENVTAAKRLDTARKNVEIKQQEGIANKAIADTLTPEFLQHEYNQAIATCAANANCHLIVDGSQSGKILNIAK